MYKVLVVKESIGGTLEYQAKIKSKVTAELEKQLNALAVENVYGVFPSEDENEFQLIAVVKVAPREIKKGGK